MAFITLPTTIQANVDPKVAEICMKAVDFKGCVESMSGMKNNSSPKSEYKNALVLLESGDSAGAINEINKYLEKIQTLRNPIFRAVINSWDLDTNDAIKDLNKAIEIDDQYADAYAVRGSVMYWDLSNSHCKK